MDSDVRRLRATKHFPALDGLRGLAILLVLASHTFSGLQGALWLYQDTTGMQHSFNLPRWLDVIAYNGYHGVTLFFVVSAFTLTRQLVGRDSADLSGYLLRRVFRIGPGFWVACTVYALWLGFGPRQGAPAGFHALDLLSCFTFTGWLVSNSAVNFVPGGWSVQAEIAFYVLLPLVVWISQAKAWRAGFLAIMTVAVVQLLARQQMAQQTWNYDVYTTVAYQLPVFMIGATVAYLVPGRYYFDRLISFAPIITLSLLALAIIGVPFSPLHDWHCLGHVQFAALVGLATLLAAWHPPRLLCSAFLTQIGTVSYSMYLIHFALMWPVYNIVTLLFPMTGILTFTLYFAGLTATSYGFAKYSYRWIEQPPRRWIAARLRAPQHTLQQPIMP